MGIYRCNHCKHIQEHILHRSMPQTKCAQCGQDVTVYDTVQFVAHIINRWAAVARELEALKNQENQQSVSEQEQAQERHQNVLGNVQFTDTDILANAQQHQPLLNWFQQKAIRAQFNYDAVNMSGCYDEAAEAMGKHYAVFKDIVGRIGWAYRNNHSGLNLDLKKYSQKEAQQINNICREFYSHTLFSRYVYQKQEKLVHLKLQSAAPIRQFFSGEWLEWYALGKLLAYAEKQGKNYVFSCARNAEIYFSNDDKHELDVVFLAKNKLPLVIECKTGEYRRDLDKYLTLRKRLDIPAENFVLLVTDIDETQAKSLSSMYELTFVTLSMLPQHIQSVI